MWELMAIGIEMQQRMIEVHAKGLKLTRDMLREAGRQAGSGAALAEAGRAQEQLVDQWLSFWRGRN
jgi:hypothetical protein